MKSVNIILIGISLFFVVLYCKELVVMMAKGNYDAAAIYFIGVLLNIIPIIMLISEK